MILRWMWHGCGTEGGQPGPMRYITAGQRPASGICAPRSQRGSRRFESAHLHVLWARTNRGPRSPGQGWPGFLVAGAENSQVGVSPRSAVTSISQPVLTPTSCSSTATRSSTSLSSPARASILTSSRAAGRSSSTGWREGRRARRTTERPARPPRAATCQRMPATPSTNRPYRGRRGSRRRRWPSSRARFGVGRPGGA